MALVDLWKSKPAEYVKKHIQQLVGIAGDGTLKDGSETSKELRELLGAVDTPQLGKFLGECLEAAFNDSGLVLQDIVNELGSRLDCDVIHGLYRGKSGQVGFDGLWSFPDGYSIVVEVKTTDAYTINLDTIADYKKQLVKAGKIKEQSSILVVVGRKDTGSLEAQVRGSRHAWEIRLISADALFRLVTIKESADNKTTISKIRTVLKPLELTKLDFVVDLLASTADDIQESSTEPEEAESTSASMGGKKFTPVAFNDEVAKRVAVQLGMVLKKATRSLYVSVEQSLAVRALVSKAHVNGDVNWYWYAFHPNYKDTLQDYKRSYVAFGCGSAEKVLLFPLSEFVEWLDKLNTTETEDRMYWHVHFGAFPDGAIRLILKGGHKPVEVRKCLLN